MPRWPSFADYNQSQELSRSWTLALADLAAERIRAHPVRYYVGAARCCAPPTCGCVREPRFFRPMCAGGNSTTTPKYSALAVGFGLLNLAYLGAAAWALVRRRSTIRGAGLLVTFIVLRSVLLLTLENPEPRYTLECFPVVIVLGAALASDKKIA